MRQRRAAAAPATPEPEDREPPLLPTHGHAPPPSIETSTLPCPGCRALTERTVLATYGNRCEACYRAFCQANTRTSHPLPDKRTGGDLAWAHALLERHRLGHNVSQLRLKMARDALGGRLALPDADG